jgi:hypothetical protein
LYPFICACFHMSVHVTLFPTLGLPTCSFPYAYKLYSYQHSYPFLSEILYMFLSSILCVDVRIRNCSYLQSCCTVYFRPQSYGVSAVLCSCQRICKFQPLVLFLVFSRPLSYIFLSAVLHVPVHCPTFSRSLSFTFPFAVLHVPVRCSISSRPLC